MIHFAANPTGWSRTDRALVPGGMAACHIDPVTRHLPDGAYTLGCLPTDDDGVLNVLYTHWATYQSQIRRHARLHRGPSVFAGHGIADKGWRNPAKVGADYDHVVSSGPRWTARYLDGGIERHRVHEIGYPKLDPIFRGEVACPWPARDGRVRVVWAPTHGGGGEKGAHRDPHAGRPSPSTQWEAEAIVGALPSSEFHVVAALHPRHRPDKRATLAEFVGADVVIADGGSTMWEAWALDLPVVFPAWLCAEANLARHTWESEVYRDRIGRHARYPSALARLAAEAAADGITGAEQDAVEEVLPRGHRGRGGEMFAEVLASLDVGAMV